MTDCTLFLETVLDWVINGPISRFQERESDDGQRQSFLVNCIAVTSIEDMLMKHYNADFLERRCDDKQKQSPHDKQFMHTVTTSAQLINSHFCIKLPLKDDKVKMPCTVNHSDERVWFIPHHGVYHPKKGILRAVFNRTATYQRVSTTGCCKGLT